jgi:hypothetical protein
VCAHLSDHHRADIHTHLLGKHMRYIADYVSVPKVQKGLSLSRSRTAFEMQRLLARKLFDTKCSEERKTLFIFYALFAFRTDLDAWILACPSFPFCAFYETV